MELGSKFVYLSPAVDCEETAQQEVEVVKVREEDNVVISDDSDDDDDGQTCLLDILDTAGQEEYSAMRELYTRTGDGFIIVYSVTDPNSFQEAEAIYSWTKRFKDQGSLYAVLCGNKMDLESERKVSTEQGRKLADSLGVPFCETSAKTGDHVTEVFKTLLRTIPRTGSDYKIVMLGTGGVGKSSITLRFTQDTFIDLYDPTIEDSYRKLVTVSGLPKGDKHSKKKKKKTSKLKSMIPLAGKNWSKSVRDRPSSAAAASGMSAQRTTSDKPKGFFSSLRRVFSARRKSVPAHLSPPQQQHEHEDEDDDGDDSDVEVGAAGGGAGVETRTARHKKLDGNVVLVSVGQLGEEPDLLTGDPVQCGQCDAVLSSTSKLTTEPESITKTWVCEFCGFLNAGLDLEEDEVPQGSCFDFMLSPAPSAEANAAEATADKPSPGLEAGDMKKAAGYVVYCMDVSGSMSSSCQVPDFQAAWRVERTRGQSTVGSVSRLECIKEAVQRQVEQLHLDQPQKRVLVLSFDSDVKVVGGGVVEGQGRVPHFKDLNSLSFKQLIQRGAQMADGYQLQPLQDSFTQLNGAVERLRNGGSTALGPALAICLGFLGPVPNSEIILCTDGMPNVGVGSLSGNQLTDFYRMAGDYAKAQKTVINILGVEGEQMGMPQVQVAAERSGGTVNILNPLEVVRQLRQIMQNPIVATAVNITCFLHPDFVFDEPGYPDNSSRICKELGNVLKEDSLTFRFRPRLLTQPPSLTCVPFQIQMAYTRLDGSQCLRVLSQSSQATSDRTEMEEGINVSVLGTAAVKTTAALAQAGKVKEANLHLKSVKRLAKRGAKTVEQKEDLCAFRAECQELDDEISNNMAQWNSAPAHVQENRSRMLFSKTKANHRRFQNASKKSDQTYERVTTSAYCSVYNAYQF